MIDNRILSADKNKVKEVVREELANIGVLEGYRLHVNNGTRVITIKFSTIDIPLVKIYSMIEQFKAAGRKVMLAFTDRAKDIFDCRYGKIGSAIYANTKDRRHSGVVAETMDYIIMFEAEPKHVRYFYAMPKGGRRIGSLHYFSNDPLTEDNVRAWIRTLVLLKGHAQLVSLQVADPS